MIRLIVFDMDDTLYDEIDYCRSGYKACGRWLSESRNISPDAVADALWWEFENGNRTKTFNTALQKLNIDCTDELIKQLIKLYRNHKPDIKLPDESKKVLDTLSAEHTLALLTDGFLPAQQLKVASLSIESYFKSIIFSEMLGRQFWKPSVVGFEKILDQTGILPQQSVYIGDNAQKDFIGPNKLGFTTIQISRPNAVHKDDGQGDFWRPNYQISSLNEIIELIKVIYESKKR